MNRSMSALLAVALLTPLAAVPVAATEVPPPPWTLPIEPGFAYGVTSGEVAGTSARVWTRAGEAGTVKLQVATDRAFRKVVERRSLEALDSNDFTVQSRVTGLKPGTRYFYRFELGGESSPVGKFRTADKRNSTKPVSFAFSGDVQATPDPATGKPYFNDFEAFDAMVAEKNSFNVLLGDTIYSDTQVGGEIDGVVLKSPWTATTVSEKWSVYRQNLALDPMAKFRGATSVYTHWDDHEFTNNFTREDYGEAMFAAGRQAFADYVPLPRYSQRTGYYRSQQWNKNLEFFFLDQVSFRTKKAEDQCANPMLNGGPDLAPTLPPAMRNTYKLLVPSMAWEVSKECTDAINNPKRQVLGKAQINRFLKDLERSKATFKVVFVQGPIQEITINQYDRMESYAVERARLLKAMKKVAPKNVIFLTTDVHANFIGDVRVRTFGEGGPTKNLYKEVTTGPIAATTHRQQLIGGADRPRIADLVRDLFYTAPVDKKGVSGGLGMTCANLDTYSYGQVDVTKKKLTVTLKDLNGKRVLSEGGATVPAGKPCPVVVLKK